MAQSEQEIDRSTLKSFRDITNLQSKHTYSSRRNWSYNLPSHYIIRRIPSNRQSDPFQVPAKQSPTYITYTCIRKKAANIKGRKVFFYFKRNDTIIYSAKYKSTSPFIPIDSGDTPHINGSSEHQVVLLYTNDLCDFSLRRNNSHGEELMSIQFRRYEHEARQPRRLTLYFFDQKENLPQQIESMPPEQTEEMTWCIDLNDDDAITSIKNCRIEDPDHNIFEIIRKTQEDILEIEAQSDIEPAYLFATAIASFLCKR